MATPRIVALTAPSGAGKTTVAQRVLSLVAGLSFSVSATTRPPRDGERDGVDYHFVSENDFRRMLDGDLLIESEEVYPDLFYGTPRAEVEKATRDQPVLLDIDVLGALRISKLYRDDTLTVFIRPPSMDVLRNRLLGRGSEGTESLGKRLRRVQFEMEHADRFDAVVVNDDLERAVAETVSLINAFLERQST